MKFKLRPNLSINSRDLGSFSIEILFNKDRNTLINILHRLPKGVIEPFETFSKEILNKTKNNLKLFDIACDLNLNILDYGTQLFKFAIRERYDTSQKQAHKSNQKNGYSNHILLKHFIDVNFKTALTYQTSLYYYVYESNYRCHSTF